MMYTVHYCMAYSCLLYWSTIARVIAWACAGKRVARDMIRLVVTLLTLYRLRQYYASSLTVDRGSLMDQEAWLPVMSTRQLLLSAQMDAITRAVNFCQRLTREHVLLRSSLELGRDWSEAAEKLIGTALKKCRFDDQLKVTAFVASVMTV